MPITQPRMLSLINAAQDYQRALRRLCNEINLQYQLSPENSQLSHLAAIATEAGLLDLPIESSNTIALEAAHFSKTWKRNNRTAIKQAQRRGCSITRTNPIYLHLPNLLEQEKHFQPEALTPEQKALIEAEAAAMQQQEKEEEFTIE